jgi:hypothetical protein
MDLASGKKEEYDGHSHQQTDAVKQRRVRAAARGPSESPERLRDGAIQLDPMRVRPVSGFPNVRELAERVNVQGLVLDDENTIVEHKLAGQRAEIRNQERC